MSTAASEIARRIGDLHARYMHETLAQVDARCDRALSSECSYVADVLGVLQVAVVTGNYHRVPRDVRAQIMRVADHVMRKHPQHWHLFFDEPTAAQRALLDQIDAARREAEHAYGTR